MILNSSLLLACVFLLSGCAAKHTDPGSASPGVALSPSGVKRVEMVNLSSRMAAFDGSAVDAGQFLQKMRGIRGEPAGRLRHLVARFPDASVELLRNPQASMMAEELSSLAAAFDAVYCAAASERGWNAVYAATPAPSADGSAFSQRRGRILSLIEQGRCDAAATEQSAIEPNLHPFLRAECLRLCGIARLLQDQYAQAIAAWRAARQLAASDANTSAELSLLICDAHRRAGEADAWRAAWVEAVGGAASVLDPALWQRAIELRPASTPWPAAPRKLFLPSAAPTSDDVPLADVWQNIAQWRLARGEAPLALLAYSQAEAQTTIPAAQAQARVGQARALLLMNQPGAASSVLASIAGMPDPALANPAIAILGVMRLEQGQTEEGLSLLQKSVEADPALRWPGLTQAQADLGLAYLTSGDEAKGLQWLRRAQEQFKADGDAAEMSKCLLNEARYFESRGQNDAAAMAKHQAELAWDLGAAK